MKKVLSFYTVFVLFSHALSASWTEKVVGYHESEGRVWEEVVLKSEKAKIKVSFPGAHKMYIEDGFAVFECAIEDERYVVVAEPKVSGKIEISFIGGSEEDAGSEEKGNCYIMFFDKKERTILAYAEGGDISLRNAFIHSVEISER